MTNVSSFHACAVICGGRADHAAANIGLTFTLRLTAVMLATLDSFKSPWPLMLPALVHASIWLIQVVGCAVDSLDGELHYRVCKEPNGLIQIYRHGDLDDGNSSCCWRPGRQL